MKILVLGPIGTFSYLVALKYKKEKDEIIPYSTIDEVVSHLKNEDDIALVPIENTLDGYVQRTLDLLYEENVYIVEEVKSPVSFDLVGNCESIKDIKKLYVQFKANGQCRKFINSLNNDIEIINTESNMESYNNAKKHEEGVASIVPSHINDQDFSLFIPRVTDYEENETRFVVLKKKFNNDFEQNRKIRVSLFIIPTFDHAGLLYGILKKFYYGNINLSAIISRPKKTEIGKYNFYIEFIIPTEQYDTVYKFLNDQEEDYEIKFLGSSYVI
ncbi:MAG: prephenate dehydratase domain-containing protein [Bacillales bacterium]|nr:prephenate dehydratase domain-containing protein [Bacillales bacterium]MDD6808055.1 prephenate dehydratase domain-containing protein [Oscillospiraceae bacterium]